MRKVYKVLSSFMFEDDIVKNKESGNIYTVKSHNPTTQALIKKDASEEDLEKVKKGEYEDDGNGEKKELKKISSQSKKNAKQRLEKARETITIFDDTTQERFGVLDNAWNMFLDAETYEEQVEAIRTLAENNLIEAHAGGVKIYLTPQTGLPYKFLTSDTSKLTTAMNDIIRDEGIEVPLRGSSKDRQLANESGEHNEAGVVAYLDPSEENTKEYKQRRENVFKLGGDDSRLDEMNKKAAEQIKQTLPKGSRILGARKVGGIGEKALKKLGIDPKKNPTDLIITYVDEDGNEKTMKVSSKIYKDPSNINMKNSGLGTAGSTYLDDSSVDSKLSELKKKYDWKNEKNKTKRGVMMTKFREEYLTLFSNSMVKLSKEEEGQKQLLQMWKDIHGCDADVYTQVVNKTTGESELRDPGYYCNPEPPFDVSYDGKKLVVEMKGGSNQKLEIKVKTETSGATKLMFWNKKNK